MTVDHLRTIPADLRARPQWVAWRVEHRADGAGVLKATKAPLELVTGKHARSSDPTTWAPFDLAAELSTQWDGIGFVFSANDPFVGVDLDACRDPETGDIVEWARPWIERFGTYGEVSPSGTGVKLFGRGTLPEGAWHKKSIRGAKAIGGKAAAVEVYDRGKFFAVTGWHLEGTPTTLADCSAALLELQAAYAPKAKAGVATQQPAVTATPGEAAIIDKVRANARSNALWRGDWEGEGYPSQSEADLALCGAIAYYAGPDRVTVDRIFRQSRLLREKWDSPKHGSSGSTYGADTIAFALAGKTKFYDWTRNGKSESSDGDDDGDGDGDGGDGVIHNTDLGNSTRMVRWLGANLRHSRTHGWLTFDGKRWRNGGIGENAAVQAAKATVRRMYVAAAGLGDTEWRELAQWALKSESALRINAMVGLARTEPVIAVEPQQFDAHPWLLNVENGTLDLRSGTRRDHRREDYHTRITPIRYDAGATCPQFNQFLLEIMDGKQELVDYLQRAIGYTLTGFVSEQVLFFLHGMGANGKSTLMRVLLALLGEYGAQAAPGLLLESRGDRHPTERADLAGRRLVVSVEVGEGKRMAEELVKQMTGGDKIKGRFMRADFFEFEPEFKLWLAANHKPIIRGTDHAIWRRIPLVPFDVTFTDNPDDGNPNKDAHLVDKLLLELPGILAWAVRGCLEWQKQGLNPPQAVAKATQAYRAEMDVVSDFFEERCVFGEGKKVRTADLQEAYRGWCQEAGEKPISAKAMAGRLREKGCEDTRDGYNRWWHGVGLVSLQPEPGGGNRNGEHDGSHRPKVGDQAQRSDDRDAVTDHDATFGINALENAHEAHIGKVASQSVMSVDPSCSKLQSDREGRRRRGLL